MAFVKFINTGQTFYVEEYESILEAAIRNGVPLDYGCSTGNCGKCKVLVRSGSVRPCKTFDHVLSEAEKLQGYALMCSHTCDEDIEIQADQLIGHQDIAAQTIEVKVKRVRELQKDIVALTVQTPRTQRLRFAAGQYVKLTHNQYEQSAFIASCPCDDRLIEFHFRLLPDNPFVENVLTQVRAGALFTLDGPHGQPGFYQQDNSSSLLLIAFDIGFAAAKSIIEHLFSQDFAQSIHLIRLSCQEEAYLDNLCRSWADAFELFSYSTVLVEQGPAAGFEPQTIEAFTSRLQPQIEALDIKKWFSYVVMPNALLTQMQSWLTSLGVLPEKIQLEPIRGELYARCNLLNTI